MTAIEQELPLVVRIEREIEELRWRRSQSRSPQECRELTVWIDEAHTELNRARQFAERNGRRSNEPESNSVSGT